MQHLLYQHKHTSVSVIFSRCFADSSTLLAKFLVSCARQTSSLNLGRHFRSEYDSCRIAMIVLGSVCSSISCCFGNAFCSLCCTACPACKGSTSTRIAYGLVLLTSLILSCIMLVPGIEPWLIKIPALCQRSNLDHGDRASLPFDCSQVVGSLAVYRLSFGVAAFFFVLSLLVRKSQSLGIPRSTMNFDTRR
jgi:Serine incorporator (Serinc)